MFSTVVQKGNIPQPQPFAPADEADLENMVRTEAALASCSSLGGVEKIPQVITAHRVQLISNPSRYKAGRCYGPCY
jgi:hypothetical protein